MSKSFDLGKVVGELLIEPGYAEQTFANELSTAGCRGWYYKDLSKISATVYQLTICDKMGQAVTDCHLGDGAEISWKADYSANFCGTISFTNRSVGLAQVTLYKELPENWVPEAHQYDYDETALKPGRGYLWPPLNPGLGKIEIGYGAAAFGSGNQANELGAFAVGENNLADGRYSFASGSGNKVGYSSHAEGQDNEATGLFSHAEGKDTKATAAGAHSEGRETTASGLYSHAEGYQTTASGKHSHAEGKNTEVTGEYSHAEGLNTKVTGKYGAHAEGEGSQAAGNSAHAEGLNTKAGQKSAHAEGESTETGAASQHVQGKYNKVLGASYVDVTGWGTASAKRNIEVLDTDGNKYLHGDLYVGATGDDGVEGARKIEDRVFVIRRTSGTSIDRTYEEIEAAEDAGKAIILLSNNVVYPMDAKDSGSYYFSSVQFQRGDGNFSGVAVRRYIINSNGVLTGQNPTIKRIVPNPPESGTFTLKSVDGVPKWV